MHCNGRKIGVRARVPLGLFPPEFNLKPKQHRSKLENENRISQNSIFIDDSQRVAPTISACYTKEVFAAVREHGVGSNTIRSRISLNTEISQQYHDLVMNYKFLYDLRNYTRSPDD